jgi:glycosyltransferase involved in cell wall biosynthesis
MTPEPDRPSISVFFPAFNDAPSLPSLIGATFALAGRLTDDFEVIVVNDGSRDNPAAVLERLRRDYGERLRVVTHEVNQGYGAALRSGFAASRKDLVFYTDGDGQYDVNELPVVLERLGPRTGFVNGYKLVRHDPFHRVWIGRIYNSVARFLFGVEIRDIDCDYRLIRRQLLDEISLESTSGTVCVELVRKLETAGWDFAEAGVHHYPRLYGRSQFFRVRSLLVTFCQLAQLYTKLVIKPALTKKAHRTA